MGKVGLMIRDDAASTDSKHYFVSLLSGLGASIGDRVFSQWRDVAGEPTSNSDLFTDAEGRYVNGAGNRGLYVRVTRRASENLFTSEWSYDGVRWRLATTHYMEMGDKAAYGLAVTNHQDNNLLAHAAITNVTLFPAPPVTYRSLSTENCLPGESVEVTLEVVNSNENSVDVTITEMLPDGWTTGSVSDGGVERNGEITWLLPVEPGSTTLIYTASPPPNSDGFVRFYGESAWLPTGAPDRVAVTTTGADTVLIGENIGTSAFFPDSNFLACVEEFMGFPPGGRFTAPMAAAKTGNLDCSFQNIADLTGIGFFTGIGELNCQGNQLTSLDVSENTALDRLDCSQNRLTDLSSLRANDGLGNEDIVDVRNNCLDAVDWDDIEALRSRIGSQFTYSPQQGLDPYDFDLVIDTPEYIPDDAFRHALELSLGVGFTDYDAATRQYGRFSVSGLGIRNLKGIEFFRED